MTRLSVLDIDRIDVATPCTADWSEMLGDERARFCGQCEKHVYNLSAMSRDEIHALIEETEGVFCGRLYRRADGTVLTTDCPVGLAEKARRAAKKAARRTLAFAALVCVSLVSGTVGFFSARARSACQSGVEQLEQKVEEWRREEVPMGGIAAPPEVMGDIALPQEVFEQGEVIAE